VAGLILCKNISLWRSGKPGPFFFKTGTALSVSLRTRITIGPASRVIDFGKRLHVLPLLLHRLTGRRVRRATAARKGIEALNRLPGAPSEANE
jgi:hypothetical protein